MLIINGGEPALRPDFPELVCAARDRGYEWTRLHTNGRVFSDGALVRRLSGLLQRHPVRSSLVAPSQELGLGIPENGRFEFAVSLFGPSAAIHDSVSRSTGSFDETVAGIRNLVEAQAFVSARVPFLAENLRVLPQTADFLLGLGVGEIEFFLPKIRGKALLSPEQLPGAAEGIVSTALRRGASPANPMVFFSDVPLCLLQEERLGHHQSEFYYPCDKHERYVLWDNGALEDFGADEAAKAKQRCCEECSISPVCPGVWKSYLPATSFRPMNAFLSGKTAASGLELAGEEADFAGIRADAVVVFSGGVDSRVASSLYAQEHADQKIVLLTFDSGFLSGLGAASKSAAEVMSRHPNIVRHLAVPIPRRVFREIVLDGGEELRGRFGKYFTCHNCHFAFFLYAVFLSKKYFGSRFVVTGHRVAETAEKGREKFVRFLSRYGMQLSTPVWRCRSKKDVLGLARAAGIDESSAKGALGQQAKCLLDPIRSSPVSMRMAVDSYSPNQGSADLAYWQGQFEKLERLLAKAGVNAEN